MMKRWFDSGAPWLWLSAAAVSASLILVVGLLALIAIRGAVHFWPSAVAEFSYREAGGTRTLLGEIVDSRETIDRMIGSSGFNRFDGKHAQLQYLVKTGNRDVTGMDFRWLLQRDILTRRYPAAAIVLERREWGNFYGYPVAIKENGTVIAEAEQAAAMMQTKLRQALAVYARIEHLEKNEIGAINYALESLRLERKRLQLAGRWQNQAQQRLADEQAGYERQYRQYRQRLADLYRSVRGSSLIVRTADGQTVDIPFAQIVRIYRPNALSVVAKLHLYWDKVAEFLTSAPREANTEGGVFPAIFGTVMMVMIMSVIVTPLGVVAAIYLHEYAKQGWFTRLIRIAVNNLAGVPSIVYGAFGLGFFVYMLGGSIDRLFYPEAAPAPVFGTPGLLWASLTLALLTLPVVIVSTEEGLARIPKSIREGSLALGATQAETLWRTVLPMASPAMMTGVILAVARAAGEVAPLMLVGVVKLAPSLPVDGNYPFLHLDRKFMHLGFHIYDVGFQSPNVEAARPLVYATSLLLVSVIIGLNLAAVALRNHLREKYRALED